MFLCCCPKCHSHPSGVDEFENITRVQDYHYPPDPAGIAPYARTVMLTIPGELGGTTDCKETHHYCGDGSSSGPSSGQPACSFNGFDFGVARPIGGVLGCDAIDENMVVEIARNCYRRTGNKVSFQDPCKSMGWKGVQALAVWVGRKGYSAESCCADDPETGNKVGGLDQFKYTAITENLAFESRFETLYESGPTYSHTQIYRQAADWNQTAEVDRYGNVTRSGGITNDWSYSKSGPNAGDIPNPEYSFTDCNKDHEWDSAVLNVPKFASADCGIVTLCGISGTPEYLNSVLAGSLYCSPNTIPPEKPGPPTVEDPLTRTVTIRKNNRGTVTLQDDVLFFEFETDYTYIEETWSFDPGPSTWYVSLRRTNTYYTKNTFTSTLSKKLYLADVRNDAEVMLSLWDLTDDAQYPWRTDAKTWLQPRLSRHAAATPPTINWATDAACSFGNDIQYTGEITGAPLPAGYGRHFDFYHVNCSTYFSETDSQYHTCNESLGATSPPEIPRTATAWTNKFEGLSQWGSGAHLVIDPGGFSVLVQKWAETFEKWPRLNRARGDEHPYVDEPPAGPATTLDLSRGCGHDRALLDEDAVTCVCGWDSCKTCSTTPNIETTTWPGGSVYFNTITSALVAGHFVASSGVGTTREACVQPDPEDILFETIPAIPAGIYKVISGGTSSAVLTAKLYELPDWILDSFKGHATDDIESVEPPRNFGRLRYFVPSGVANRPICGRLKVVAAVQDVVAEGAEATITVTVDRKAYLLGRRLDYTDGVDAETQGEKLDFTGVAGLDAGVEVVSVTSLATFKVAGTLTAAYAAGGHVVSAGVTSVEWNKDSTCSEHRFAWMESISRHRAAHDDPLISAYEFRPSFSALLPKAKHPSVLYCTPNAEVFPNGYAVPFVSQSYTTDQCFGADWHVQFIQAVPDPYWQQPVKCSDAMSQPWFMDCAPCAPCLVQSSPTAIPVLHGQYSYYPLVEPRYDFPYFAAPLNPAPVSGGNGVCEPNERATVHTIRADWLACTEWKEQANANCGSKGY